MKNKTFDWRRISQEKRLASVTTSPSSYDADARTVECIISMGSPVSRYYGTETLRISQDAVILDRMKQSGIPLLDSHNQHGIDNALGRFSRVWVGTEKGKPALLGRITFNDTERGRLAEGMVARGEIKGISAGYQVREWEIRDKNGTVLDPEIMRINFDDDLTFEATRWELLEGSLVSVPADGVALIRSFGNESAGAAALARMQERQRKIDNAPQHDDDYDDEPVATINQDMTTMRFQVLRDEREGAADAMSVALARGILGSRGRTNSIEYKGPKGNTVEAIQERELIEQSRQYMGMGLVEMAAHTIGYRRRSNFFSANDSLGILERAFQTTSDFPSIFQNALNKALLARYELFMPTYREIAAERQFKDFRPHPQVRAGDFPTLQEVKETGELQYGSTTDNGEPISVKAYGTVFSITRQMLMNDNLGAIDQILSSAGDMVLVFENTTFYAMFNSNPVLNQDSTAVFAAGHNNLASSGAAPSVTTIGAGREALRGMKSPSGNFLNVPPAIILTGPAQETAADQMITAITPTLTTSVNPFSGRLRSVSDANIGDNSWYLLADPVRLPNFIYGFLAGQAGPRTRTYEPFGVQGVKVSLEHDFGVGAIDYRGAYKSPSY